MNSARKRVLVVGLGISGMSTAIRLDKAGWDVTVVERSATRRRGGYFVALFGSGMAAARRLDIAEAIPDRTSSAPTYEIDRTGRRRIGLGYGDLAGTPRMLVRGDIEEAAFRALPSTVSVRYATQPVALHQDPQGVDVDLKNADGEVRTERFDLVVGADGLRSTIRRLGFGVEAAKTHPLGFMIAAFSLTEPVPGFRQEDSVILTEKGRSAWVFSFSDRPGTVLFTYQTDDVNAEFSRRPIDSVRRAFGPGAPGTTLGWLLDRFEESDEFLFDSAEQVRMEHWHTGRVVLVGDAAWCPTLYSGMGASTGMAGAELLGTMLDRHPGDVPAALSAWEAKLSSFIEHHQQQGVGMRVVFAPVTPTERFMRSTLTRALRLPLLGSIMSAAQTRSTGAKMKMMDVAA